MHKPKRVLRSTTNSRTYNLTSLFIQDYWSTKERRRIKRTYYGEKTKRRRYNSWKMEKVHKQHQKKGAIPAWV